MITVFYADKNLKLKSIKLFKQNNSINAYLQLCRPANLPTAAADIIAGMSLAGIFNNFFNLNSDQILLIFSSILLYGGGITLNDVFDFKIDLNERPERPIPSGNISYKNALVFGLSLIFIGITLSFLVNNISGIIALILFLSIISYNKILKNYIFLGPLNMGACRALNLLLGISILGELKYIEYTIVPIIFIFALTMISNDEVYGNNKKNLIFSAFLYVTVIFILNFLHITNFKSIHFSSIFLILFALMTFKPLIKAFIINSPKNIKRAVKSGVLSIIILNCAIAIPYSHWHVGIFMLLLLPLSIFLSKIFNVT